MISICYIGTVIAIAKLPYAIPAHHTFNRQPYLLVATFSLHLQADSSGLLVNAYWPPTGNAGGDLKVNGFLAEKQTCGIAIDRIFRGRAEGTG